MKQDEDDEEDTPVKKERAPRKARASVKKEESEEEVKAEGESDAACSSAVIHHALPAVWDWATFPRRLFGDRTRLSGMGIMTIASSSAKVLFRDRFRPIHGSGPDPGANCLRPWLLTQSYQHPIGYHNTV